LWFGKKTSSDIWEERSTKYEAQLIKGREGLDLVLGGLWNGMSRTQVFFYEVYCVHVCCGRINRSLMKMLLKFLS
jgi:hypothetical protein